MRLAVNALVSPDSLSAAVTLAQFVKMADQLEPVLADAQRSGWRA